MDPDANGVLVVDDVVPNIKLLSSMLHSRNYTVYEATNGLDALAVAREKSPAIILLDIIMPDMDGFEVCKKLKADPATAGSSVIYISARNTAEDKIHGLELGAVDYITKPFQKAEVLARVDTHMALQTAKARLKESETRYSTLVEAVQDGIILWEPEKGVVFSNKPFRRIVEAGDDEPLKLQDFIAPQDLKPFEDKLNIALAAPQRQPIEHEVRMARAGAMPHQTSCLIVGVKLSGKPAALATVRDMTSKLAQERQLQQTRKMESLSLLSAGIAHDFNNILALVNGYAELALLETGPDSPVADKLRNILAAGRNAVSLTKGLLSLSKNKRPELEPVDLNTEIKGIHSLLVKAMPKAISFTCETPQAPLPALADPAMLQQMIVNICLNGRDAMLPAGGQLKISTAKVRTERAAGDDKADFACISVSDTGAGIPDSIKADVFDPFFTTKRNGKSAGLGLSVADRIARNHNGWIDLESVEGSGSTFKIFIPLSASLEARERPAQRTYKHRMREELNDVLVAAGDDAELAIICHFMEKEGYRSVPATSAAEAVETLKAEPGRFKLLVISRDALERSKQSLPQFQKRFPDLKLLLISESGAVPVTDVPRLKKTFAVKDLLQALDSL